MLRSLVLVLACLALSCAKAEVDPRRKLLAAASQRTPACGLDDPERGIVRKDSAKLEDKDCVITRMTIFGAQTP
jgi:hypothetical protein